MIRLNLIACSLASSLVLLPSLAMAASPQCVHSEPRDLKLDLAGAKAVVFEVNRPDLVLQAREIVRVRAQMEKVLARHTGQPLDRVRADTDRDTVFPADQAVAYGLVDEVFSSRG